MKTLPKLVAVVGPTASGKTALGESLALEFGGEIVSADSRQVYIGMDIGTAKDKKLKVPQHLIDIKQPGERMTVAEYQGLAYEVIDQLLQRGRVPFLVGGSGLYVESVLEGYLFTGEGNKEKSPRYTSLKLGIQLDREVLRERVAARTEKWLHEGLLEEIKDLLSRGVSPAWLASCGMEYRYFSEFLEGRINEDEAKAKTNIAINQFIKRQYTWWRRHSDVCWVASTEEAARVTGRFLNA